MGVSPATLIACHPWGNAKANDLATLVKGIRPEDNLHIVIVWCMNDVAGKFAKVAETIRSSSASSADVVTLQSQNPFEMDVMR